MREASKSVHVLYTAGKRLNSPLGGKNVQATFDDEDKNEESDDWDKDMSNDGTNQGGFGHRNRTCTAYRAGLSVLSSDLCVAFSICADQAKAKKIKNPRLFKAVKLMLGVGHSYLAVKHAIAGAGAPLLDSAPSLRVSEQGVAGFFCCDVS